MNVALIPPYELTEYYTDKGRLQYMLPVSQHIKNEYFQKYELIYSKHCKNNFKYVIMGPESSSVGVNTAVKESFKRANIFYPQEMIVPFKEYDRDVTLDNVLVFDRHRKHYMEDEEFWTEPWKRPKSFGFVPQGYDVDDYMACVDIVFNMHKWITAIHLPSSMMASTADKYSRVKVADAIQLKYGDWFEIHFHLMNPTFPSEMKVIPKFVRGVTTSLPFVYASEKLRMDEDSTFKYMASFELNDKYMHTSNRKIAQDYLAYNLNVVKMWMS
jgi:hypothetical protein